MTLKAMLNVLGDIKYLITACEVATGDYETIEVDYGGDISKLTDAMTVCAGWKARKNRVAYVRFNKAAGCNEIRVDLLPDRR